MADNELQVRLLHAAKTKDQWKAVTSYPKKGEVCLEAINSSGATAFKIKIGDGTRPYCQNTAPEGDTPIWDFTSDQVLPYFGSVIETSGTVNVVAISTYNTTKKKLSFYTLGLSASTSGGSTTITPTIASSPYLEIIEGTGVEFTTDETGTIKEFYINLAATTEDTATTITDGGTFTAITPDSNHKATKYTTFTLPSIADAIAELDTDSPLALVEYDSSTTTLSIYTISETDGVISKSSTAATTIDLSSVAPVQDVQINSTSILDNSGNANLAVEGTYNASSNKIATESTVSDAVEGLDVNGYAQAEIDTTTTSGQTTLTIKGIEEVNGEIAVDTTNNTSIVIDGTYNASTNKIATESTVSDVIATLDGNATTVNTTNTPDVIVSVSESDGIVSSTKKTLVAGDKIDIDIPTTGTSTGDIIISHENIDTTATDVASTITTDGSSTVDEKELSIITGIKVDAQGHITHIDKDVSTNLVAADIKAPVKQTDNSTWNHRVTGGDISIGEDTAKIPVLKGNTIVWNQLVGSSATSVTLVINNKYFTVVGGTKSIQTGAGTDITVTGGTDIVIDLTKMFGAGNEPSTVEEFEKLFPNDYYEYNEGELVSLFDSSKSFNVWDEEWELGNYNDNGEKQISTLQIRSTNAIPIFSNTNYCFTSLGNGYVSKILWYDINETFISYVNPSNYNIVLTSPSNAKYVRFQCQAVYGTTYNHDVCVNISNPEYNGIYLPYGEPLPAGVKSTGFNQWDEEWECGYYNDSGVKMSSDTSIRSANYIQVIPNETYFFRMAYITDAVFRICYYDENKNFILKRPGIVNIAETIPSNAHYLTFYATTAYGITYNHDICINISDPVKNGTYEPYKQDTLDLSWIKDIKDSNNNQLFPNGLLSAGSVYDEVTETKAIKRVGIVDMGTLTWMFKSGATSTFYALDIRYQIAYPTQDKIANLLCARYKTDTTNKVYVNITVDKAICANGYIGLTDSSYTTAADLKTAVSGVLLYYELATPIEVDIVPAKNMSYLVDDLGTEIQLPVNPPTTTPITSPFVGTFEYKSNFKDTVIELIDKVNNAANPVKGINNTDQTVGKIAVYDSERTTHSSNYSPSNATIVEGATGNNIILPSVEALTTYVNSKLSSALTYKGTISEWSDLPTSGQNTGDMYIAASSFTEGATTYNAGDFFIWNGTSWDIVSGTTSVVNSNPTLSLDGGTYQVGTVDGVALQITTPDLNVSDPSASGNTLTFIDSVSQSDGLISATKKTVYSASTTQSGVVTLSSGIETTSNEDSKIPTAYDTLTNLNNRDVDSGTITNDIASLSKRMVDDDSGSQTYGDWINKPFYPTTKFAAINDFSTGFSTAYPDLAAIEALGSSSPTSGFPKRASDGTWSLDQNVLTKYLAPIASPGTDYTFSDPSSNDVLENLIHDYYTGGDYTNKIVTKVKKASLTNTKGFAIDVPILSSTSATAGTVLKGVRTDNNTGLPIWANLSIEELSELNNLSSNTGYLKRASSGTGYTWSLDTPVSTTVTSVHSDQTLISSSTASAGIKVTTNGDTTYHKISVSALINDTVDTLILNGNFS